MRCLLLLLCLLLPAQSLAGQKLQGLFGVELNAPCVVCQEEPVEETDGMRLYYITPPEPLEGFELYQARVDVKKHKVVDVAAVALLQEEAAARELFEGLRKRFAQELGVPEMREHHRSTRAVFAPKGSQRTLTLLLRDDLFNGRWILYLNALDQKAFARAHKAAEKQQR